MKHFILLGIALSIISCGRISNTQQLQRMYGKEIDLSVLSRQAEILSTPKIVVFHDRNQCSNCQLGRISDWDEIIAQLDSIQPGGSRIFHYRSAKRRTKCNPAEDFGTETGNATALKSTVQTVSCNKIKRFLRMHCSIRFCSTAKTG